MSPAQERTRDTIADQYKWNLTDLFPTDAAWRAEKDRLAGTFGEAAAFAGTLGQSPERLAAALSLQTAQQKAFGRLFVYANLAADQDTRVSANQARQTCKSTAFTAPSPLESGAG